ncbi:hypothetical protein B296_00049066 [Ensete ventricosum]|uniref:Vacuole membrane protein KMS1 n=1 Tax=Ensete ventricosum TaxID=4639 RepID=A0A426X689_ENSVE|nr:hypothetical protein B296_00049066 [Ensete ventricosum]
MEMEELGASSSEEDGFLSAAFDQIRHWILTHSQYLNFVTILVLASVPNPLFDLAGIMCGQFGIPFWTFFLATLFGKALIKTHIQTVFMICLCNNQLLEWLENELIWMLGFVPGISSMLPELIAKMHMIQKKYLSAPVPESTHSDGTEKQWNLSFTMLWNTAIWNYAHELFCENSDSHCKKISRGAAGIGIDQQENGNYNIQELRPRFVSY